MAKSKYEYVKSFEPNDQLLPETWIVIRIDGRGFQRFAEVHGFEKPNDLGALQLMNDCAREVFLEFPQIVFAYGVSDEYSFVLHKSSTLFQRRASKLVSVITSLFAASYVMKWGTRFPDKKILYAPCFDGRAVCYPRDDILKDYLAWRQVDCHINNQYNTCFWKLRESGLGPSEAYEALKGTQSDYKNELLFQKFKINYNLLPEIFRKGTSIYKKEVENEDGGRKKVQIVFEHGDIISDSFWSNKSILKVSKDFKGEMDRLKDENAVRDRTICKNMNAAISGSLKVNGMEGYGKTRNENSAYAFSRRCTFISTLDLSTNRKRICCPKERVCNSFSVRSLVHSRYFARRMVL